MDMSKFILRLPIACFLITLGCQHNNPTQDNNQRLIKAEVVALDQDIHFNRFGSHDPYGMIYALKSDVVSNDGSAELAPGHVTLRSGKRPRPLVLRMNKGDILEVAFTNLLSPERPSEGGGNTGEIGHSLISDKDRNLNDSCAAKNPSKGSKDSPLTRCAGIAVSGLPTVESGTPENTGIRSVPPGETAVYRWAAERTGTFLFSSLAAPSGGEGDGGSLVHGLFGAVNVESEGSEWYRSAVRESDLKRAQAQAKPPAKINYEATYDDGTPVLNLLKKIDDSKPIYQLVYSPLDAIVVDKNAKEADKKALREFTVVFHDELKTIFHDDFSILSPEQFTQGLPDGLEKDKKLAYSKQLAGVRDGFAINYGSSGMGTVLLANRLQKGPAKKCVDCLYEEFFLQSWANGDPALLAEYDDDPSNVHHSYLNDPVKFQNSHAGPKETHVFHLHAHQWLSSGSGYANYLDSQTIAPQQGFSYNIQHGGSGNRNQTPGDSIFHCHLYPHFAQGMWELWRVHDVLEDGSRRLPDGGDEDILINSRKGRVPVKPGKGTDPLTGLAENGTPIPAIVPLPYRAMPPAASYGEKGFPGFPFYIAGETGHRSPQPPLDIVKDGGLGRHIVTQGERSYPGGEGSQDLVNNLINQVKNADLRSELHTAQIKLLPSDGTLLEKNAMDIHAGKAKLESYNSITPEGLPGTFKVNGKAPQPGAPFADPCGKNPHGPDQDFKTRRYKVSAIDLDIQTNEHDWHDPQSRINVLDNEVKHYEKHRFVKDAEPFYFRAESGECVEFIHTNRTGKDLTRDDFQVATPTDIIGQHIHLVKFDVTASDGSGNGFNYQDGTMAKATIEELAKASKQPGGSVTAADGKPAVIKPNGYQQTIQRWWVDPYFHENG
jgi:hypothetical protein